MGEKLFKRLGWLTAVLSGSAVIVWLAWTPSAKEPGYVFVSAWGEPGSAPGRFEKAIAVAIYSIRRHCAAGC